MRRLLLVAAVLAAPAALACSRSQSPLEQDLALAATLADHVVAAKVLSPGDATHPATAVVQSVLEGSDERLTPTRVFSFSGAVSNTVAKMCGGTGLEVGKELFLLLWSPAGAMTAFSLVDAWGGVLPANPDTRASLTRALRAHRVVGPWQTSGDVRTRVFVSTKGGEVEVTIILRNTSAKPLAFQYSDWPEAQATRCTLSLTPETGRAIESRPVPIPPAEIAAYFSKHGRTFEVPIAVGDSHLLRLDRVTTATPGWGFKEVLGFRYYPVETHGPYALTAQCVNVLGQGTQLTTAPVRLDL